MKLLLVYLVHFNFVICSGQLHLAKVDPDVISGKYVSSPTVGIVFNSSSGSLRITDLFGYQLLAVHETMHCQWISIERKVFVQVYSSEIQGYQDYYVPKYLYKDVDHLSGQLNATVLNILRSLPSQYHRYKLQKATEMFVESPYAYSIKNLAYILGSDLRIYGSDNPSILPLYLVANMLEKLQSSSLPHTSSSDSINDDDCFEDCPPCYDQECLSLCGYGCHCWKWVCGDCCYHLGCYGHDVCCRKNFIQTKCLFPISFKCESEYEC